MGVRHRRAGQAGLKTDRFGRLVLKDGKVGEIGTHEELLANPDGEFRELVTMQTEINHLTAQAVRGG